MNTKEYLKKFLRTVNILTFSVHSEDVWICNVYFVSDDDFNIYFVSKTDTRHGKQLLEDNNLAFAASSHEAGNLKNKKGIQGLGECFIVEDIDEQKRAIILLNDKGGFERDPETYLVGEDTKKIYKIIPTYIKYTDDENLGHRGKVEIVF